MSSPDFVICIFLYPKHHVMPFQWNADGLPPAWPTWRALACSPVMQNDAETHYTRIPRCPAATSKLFQSLLGGKGKGLCLLYHTCLLQCEKNLKNTKMMQCLSNKGSWLTCPPKQTMSITVAAGSFVSVLLFIPPHDRHYCRLPSLTAKGEGT